MREWTVQEREAGQRLDRYLRRRLPAAPGSFVYKMLRKKNIVLNEKKVAGSETLRQGDRIRLWLAEETLEKFSGPQTQQGDRAKAQPYPVTALDILYEDAHVLLVNKPAGMLSQKAKQGDVSLCEYLIGYLLETGQMTEADLQGVKPSVCNRLDRNTSGIVCCGKTSAGLAALSELLRTRSVHKYYHALVMGTLREAQTLRGYIRKDEGHNTSRVIPARELAASAAADEGWKEICTVVRPLRGGMLRGREVTLAEAQLITGRSHQIRAQLAAAGHTLVGDVKYASPQEAAFFKGTLHISTQMLHCQRMVFPDRERAAGAEALAGLWGRTVTARPDWKIEV